MLANQLYLNVDKNQNFSTNLLYELITNVSSKILQNTFVYDANNDLLPQVDHKFLSTFAYEKETPYKQKSKKGKMKYSCSYVATSSKIEEEKNEDEEDSKNNKSDYNFYNFKKEVKTKDRFLALYEDHARIRLNPKKADNKDRTTRFFSLDIDRLPDDMTPQKFVSVVLDLIKSLKPNYIILNPDPNKQYSIQMIWILENVHYENNLSINVIDGCSSSPFQRMKKMLVFATDYVVDVNHQLLNAKNPFFKDWLTIRCNDQTITTKKLFDNVKNYLKERKNVKNAQQIKDVISLVEEKARSVRTESLNQKIDNNVCLTLDNATESKTRRKSKKDTVVGSRNNDNFDYLRINFAYPFTKKYFCKYGYYGDEKVFKQQLKELLEKNQYCELGKQSEMTFTVDSIVRHCYTKRHQYMSSNVYIPKVEESEEDKIRRLANLKRSNEKKNRIEEIKGYFNFDIPKTLKSSDRLVLSKMLEVSEQTIINLVKEIRKNTKTKKKNLTAKEKKIYKFVSGLKKQKMNYKLIAFETNNKFKSDYTSKELQYFVDNVKDVLEEQRTNNTIKASYKKSLEQGNSNATN